MVILYDLIMIQLNVVLFSLKNGFHESSSYKAHATMDCLMERNEKKKYLYTFIFNMSVGVASNACLKARLKCETSLNPHLNATSETR